MIVLALDPGPVKTAWCWWDGATMCDSNFGCEPNDVVREMLYVVREMLYSVGPTYQDVKLVIEPVRSYSVGPTYQDVTLVIEQVRSYGMPVGAEVLDTVHWSGRFHEAWHPGEVRLIPRLTVKTHLCHSSRANDSTIRQALLDRFGPAGTKKNPGLLYGVHGDVWAALALAVTAWDLAQEVTR